MRRLAVVFVAVVALVAGAAPASGAVDTLAAEQAFVAHINALRTGKGLQPLVEHSELTAIARRWAAAMAAADQISHNRGFSQSVRSDWEKLGENVGVGMTVDKLHAAFVASPAHYRNLVNPVFSYVGVGVVVGRDGALFTAHQFMQLRSPQVATVVEPSARLRLVFEQLRALDAA